MVTPDKTIFQAMATNTVGWWRQPGFLLAASQQEVIDIDDSKCCDVTRSHYVLNIKDKAELVNGFRYIKELLLQKHNFKMFEARRKLRENDIMVYSVKTDAFVIDTKNIEKAKTLLDFNIMCILPTKKYEIVENWLDNISSLECKELHIKNEYDTNNIIEVIKENNPVIITA